LSDDEFVEEEEDSLLESVAGERHVQRFRKVWDIVTWIILGRRAA
jgi:hypothetical protein